MPEEYVDPELDLNELKNEAQERHDRRSDTTDEDPDDEILQSLLRGDHDVADEHRS